MFEVLLALRVMLALLSVWRVGDASATLLAIPGCFCSESLGVKGAGSGDRSFRL